MALLKEDLERMQKALYIIRQQKNVDSKYKDVQCPHCTLTGWWYHREDNADRILCVACNHEMSLCEHCGTVLTDETVAKNDSDLCVSCRKAYCLEIDRCPECEEDLVPGENNGMKFLYCPKHCIDEVKMREAV